MPREVKAHEGAALSLTMGLVDGSTKKIIVSDNFTVQDVLIAYASKLGLWQVDFFSLAESRPGKSGTILFHRTRTAAHARPHTLSVWCADRWLHPAVQVGRYGIQETSRLVLKIKFFKRPRFLVDPVALRLFYLQIQTNVVAGAYPCTERLAITLAAHQVPAPPVSPCVMGVSPDVCGVCVCVFSCKSKRATTNRRSTSPAGSAEWTTCRSLCRRK